MNNIRDEKVIRRFGKKVREIRIKQGISQGQLAYEADIPLNQIGRIERGEINTTISTVVAIAKALDVQVKELLNF